MDLTEIGAFTEKRWGRAKRDSYLASIDRCFFQIADNPHLGLLREKLGPAIHALPAQKHVIFYRLEEGSALIIRVLHQSMDYQNIPGP